MRCEEVEVLIQRHLDKDLSKEEHLSLQQHVTQCSDCQQLLDNLVHISDQLAHLPKVDPPYSIVDSILPQLGLDKASPQPLVNDIRGSQTERIKENRKIHQKKRFWIPSSIVAAGLLILVLTSNFPGSGGLSNEVANDGMVGIAGLLPPEEKTGEQESSMAIAEDTGDMNHTLTFFVPDVADNDEFGDNQKSAPNLEYQRGYGFQPEFEEGILSPDKNYIAYLGYPYNDILIDKVSQLDARGEVEVKTPHFISRRIQWESPWYVTQIVWVEDNQLYVVLLNNVSEQEEYWLLTVTERGAEEEQLEEAYQIN